MAEVATEDIEIYLKTLAPTIRESWPIYAKKLLAFENFRIYRELSTLILPALLMFSTIPFAKRVWQQSEKNFYAAWVSVIKGSQLRILQGAKEPNQNYESLALGGDRLAIFLDSSNLLELSTTAIKDGSHLSVKLFRPGEKTFYQSYQLSQAEETSQDEAYAKFSLRFRVTETSDIAIGTPSKIVARVSIASSLVPVVKLELAAAYQSPWLDDTPLPLIISATAQKPLKQVRLIMHHAANKEEDVILQTDVEQKTSFTTNYSVSLAPYLKADLDRIQILAQVMDTTLPEPQIGQSQPLVLEVASAYGQYRMVLAAFRALKEEVDRFIKENGKKFSYQSAELDRAFQWAEQTPYFDLLDRKQMRDLSDLLVSLHKDSNFSSILSFSKKLNDFLIEHETLDDRERDRDFFIALRSLSHSQSVGSAKIFNTLKTELKAFLSERKMRWALRIKRLKDSALVQEWAKMISENPFAKTLDQIQFDSEPDLMQPKLSKLAQDYRHFIERLEEQEDLERRQNEQKMQDGLISAQKKLREIQLTQNELSLAIDKADQRSKEEIAAKWPVLRMKQNSNIKDTKILSTQISALVPAFASRLQVALDAMEQAIERGSDEDYTSAETAIDLAGRLLRQAEKDSMSERHLQDQERRKRKRVTGNQYYGQAMQGGDIEFKNQNYEVDRMYREDVLDEIEGNQVDKQEKSLIESYLRRVVR